MLLNKQLKYYKRSPHTPSHTKTKIIKIEFKSFNYHDELLLIFFFSHRKFKVVIVIFIIINDNQYYHLTYFLHHHHHHPRRRRRLRIVFFSATELCKEAIMIEDLDFEIS